MFETIYARLPTCNRAVLELTIGLAIEIAREGRKGQRIGTLFTLGDAAAVLERSRPLILDPLSGHPAARRHNTGLNLNSIFKAKRERLVREGRGRRFLYSPALPKSSNSIRNYSTPLYQ